MTVATVDILINKLRDLGGSANNPDLKKALGLKDKEWDQVKKGALASGRVIAGRGFGGRLMLPEHVSATSLANKGQTLPTASYGALRGKKLMLVDKAGKAQSPGVINEVMQGNDMMIIVLD